MRFSKWHWNPDGSAAEFSGNGTRIAALWLAGRSGASDVSITVGDRTYRATLRENGLVETAIGSVAVREIDTIDVAGERIELTPVSVGRCASRAARRHPGDG